MTPVMVEELYVEMAPHDSLHGWVGKESNRYLEHMECSMQQLVILILYIFYAHHSNLDCVWSVWEELRDCRSSLAGFVTSFTIMKSHSSLVRIKIRDVLNMT
ncbi:hypothetical protein FRX31_011967 [Thalictrum thalictroides]|uniref:Tyrosinase copper-binding domain-containing protein n=1 Tax=Thalictrum thalictroides TaxID=46969 RepID=A0A7J6WM63_THATH|nr:hypothetical protein FRX31_011967 [Thalictrum thalictroides]